MPWMYATKVKLAAIHPKKNTRCIEMNQKAQITAAIELFLGVTVLGGYLHCFTILRGSTCIPVFFRHISIYISDLGSSQFSNTGTLRDSVIV
jgi:hypothetical protein